jgi:hypothetical protein
MEHFISHLQTSFKTMSQQFQQQWQHADQAFLFGVGVLVLLVWFLPTLLAMIFNRQHLGKIAILNIPAGISWLAWGALCIWAATGKLSKALADRAQLPVVPEQPSNTRME